MLRGLAFVVALTLTGLVRAQAPASFEAASIKPNLSGGGGMSVQVLPGGRFVADNITFKELLRSAHQFQFEQFQVVGGPAWIEVDRFDVQATAGEQATGEQVLEMLKRLLADRFALVLRREVREMAVFEIVFARSSGRPGAQLRPTAGGCAPRALARDAGPAPPDAAGRPPCGFGYAPDKGDTQTMIGTGVTLAELAQRLRGLIQGIVIDGSGSSDRYDLRLEYLPPRLGRPQDGGVSIFTGVHDQLGLKLESRRAPVDVLVIDRVEKPTAN